MSLRSTTDAEKDRQEGRLACSLKVFALSLIEAAYQSSSHRTDKPERKVRTFKIGLKAARYCLDRADLELANKAFERIAVYASAAERIESRHDDPFAEISMEHANHFYLLRVMHAWKSNRLDLAEHMYSRLSADQLLKPELAEKAIDLFLEIGKDLTKQKRPADGANWLERAHEIICACEPEALDNGASELGLSIVSALGKS